MARELGARLGWPVYDQELLQRVAEELHVHVGQIEGLDERPGSWLQDCVQAFVSTAPGVSEPKYFRRLLQLVLSLGAQGRCVLVGRGAVFALPPSHRRRLRTINMPERLNKELKRRTRVAGLFPNEASALRLVSAVAMEISEEWETDRKYLTMGPA